MLDSGDKVRILQRCLIQEKLLGYHMLKKVWRYVKPFQHNTETCHQHELQPCWETNMELEMRQRGCGTFLYCVQCTNNFQPAYQWHRNVRRLTAATWWNEINKPRGSHCCMLISQQCVCNYNDKPRHEQDNNLRIKDFMVPVFYLFIRRHVFIVFVWHRM